MTGETENGRSMKVMSRLLPAKSNLAMAQEAARPNSRLSGTEIPATMSVKRIAASASGSRMAEKYGPSPWASASVNTMRSGSTRNSRMKVSAPPTTSQRTSADSRIAGRDDGAAPKVVTAIREPPACASSLAPCAAPTLRQVDDEQHDERDGEHDDADGGGAGIVVLLQLDDYEQWRDLRDHRHVASDEDDRAVLADGAREGQREAGQHRRQDDRQDDTPEGGEARGAESDRRLFDLEVEILQHRLHRAHGEGKPMK